MHKEPQVFVSVNAGGANTFINITLKSILQYYPQAKIFVIDARSWVDEGFVPLDDSMMKNIEIIPGIKKNENLPTYNIKQLNLSSENTLRLYYGMECINPIRVVQTGDLNHMSNIQLALDKIDEDFVLIDNDAPLIHPVDFIDDACVTIADIEVCGTNKRMMLITAGIMRFTPFIQYFNQKMIKDNDVWVYRIDEFKNYVDLAKRYTPDSIIFPTGSILLKLIQDKKLPFLKIESNKYVDHFGSGTWFNGNDANAQENRNKAKIEFYKKYAYLFKEGAIPELRL